jgi:hypothetical protein
MERGFFEIAAVKLRCPILSLVVAERLPMPMAGVSVKVIAAPRDNRNSQLKATLPMGNISVQFKITIEVLSRNHARFFQKVVRAAF